MQRGGGDALAREHSGELDQAAAWAARAGHLVVLGHQLAHQGVGEVFQARAAGTEEGVEDRVADLPLQQVREVCQELSVWSTSCSAGSVAPEPKTRSASLRNWLIPAV